MTIERPMFPPRAESADSLSSHPAIGQREGECRVSESRKPAEGLSRRVVLAGVASAAALPIAGALPTSAEATTDPIFAAIDVYRHAGAACVAAEGNIPEEAADRYWQAVSAVMRTRPTTPAGLAALTGWTRERADRLCGNSFFDGVDLCALTATIDDATRGMSGLEPWSPLPAAATHSAQTLDAELIELGARFEPLVDQYYEAQRRWSSSSAHRTDGTLDAISAIHDEMKQLPNAINAAPVNSIEGLRAKALVAFWEVAPLCAGDTEFSFDDAYPFQQLFTAVAELCGLKEKIAATGYQLPDIGIAYDDSDEDGDDDGEDA
jgi:hypothetical protein